MKGDRANMDLTVCYLIEIYNQQEGKCFLSRMELSLKNHSDWRISIERLDESNGYVKGNIGLMCLEFQSSNQWSIEKLNTFVREYSINTKIENFEEICKEATIKNRQHLKKRKIKQPPMNDKITKTCLCRDCDTIKEYSSFSTCGLKNSKCKDCHKQHNDKIKTPSLRLKLKKLISSSKNGIDKRNKSKWRKETPIIHTLTFDELLDVYITQKGKCMYSNKKLELFGDYMMSLERIDIKVGYIKENCCLICVELNVGDWSIVKNEYDDREGCSGWNKEKFNIIVNKIISMKTI
jgi:hypothetical protein